VSWTIRPARLADVPALVALRRVMFEAMGHRDGEALDRMGEASTRYFEETIPTGAFRAWIAELEGRPIASIGLIVHSVPPAPGRTIGKEAYIMSLVTVPEHRRRGIAGALVRRVLDVARAEGIPVASLHATRIGRGIYERAGFRFDSECPEMRLRLA